MAISLSLIKALSLLLMLIYYWCLVDTDKVSLSKLTCPNLIRTRILAISYTTHGSQITDMTTDWVAWWAVSEIWLYSTVHVFLSLTCAIAFTDWCEMAIGITHQSISTVSEYMLLIVKIPLWSQHSGSIYWLFYLIKIGVFINLM